MKYLKCINDKNFTNFINNDKIYKVVNSEILHNSILIIDNYGVARFFNLRRFIDVTRKLKIKQLI